MHITVHTHVHNTHTPAVLKLLSPNYRVTRKEVVSLYLSQGRGAIR